MRRCLSLAVLALSCSAFAQYPGAKMVPQAFAKGFAAITIEDARTWLEYLAGPECEGRGTGQPGYLKAAQYMADRYKEFGLKPAGDNGTYFQAVPFGAVTITSASFEIGSHKVDSREKLMITGAGKSETVAGPVGFLVASGPDAKLPEVKTKIVIAKLDKVSRDFRQALRNSKAIVFEVSDLINPERTRINLRGEMPKIAGRIHPDEWESLLKAANLTVPSVAENEATLQQGKAEAKISIAVESERSDMPNVVGWLEGSDPKLATQYVGIGAHLDHLGKNAEGVVYWGADDDASGCTALLSIAKAFQLSGLKPKRSILFMAFTGEEMGLLGSRFLAENPPKPLEDMICELQMDMVGRNSDGIQNGDRNRVDKAEENIQTIRLVGSKRISTELHDLIIRMNEHVNFTFKWDAEDVYTRSDHYSFASKGVPIAFLFDGFHPDYHRPTDTVEKINYDKVTNAAKLFFLVAAEAADRPSVFPKDVAQSGGGR